MKKLSITVKISSERIGKCALFAYPQSNWTMGGDSI